MADWSRSRVLDNGIELLEASFDRHVYERHTHDTYAIGVTLSGVQRFWCRGATNDSVAGNVMVIHPGEVHDGRSGAPGAYSYRMMYVPVATIRELIGSEPCASSTILRDPILGDLVNRAWTALGEGADELLETTISELAIRYAGLRAPRHEALDVPMLVREYLVAHLDTNVRVQELAALASMSRFQLTRQFQRAFGLPLHAYHVHLRLEEAKRRLRQRVPIAQIAVDLGFADQSHLHRRFKGAFGTTPDVWRRGLAQKSKI